VELPTSRLLTSAIILSPSLMNPHRQLSTALLKGLVFDSTGHRLQPTHCSKKGRSKYRYYVSAPMLRNARACPEGLRIPAADLEKIVINAITGKLRDRNWVSALTVDLHRLAGDAEPHNRDLTASVHQTVIASAGNLVAQMHHQTVANTGALKTIISRVEVSKTTIVIKLSKTSIARMLGVADSEQHQLAKTGTTDIIVTGQSLRCGKQVRLILGNGNGEQAKPDERLIQEVARAQRWFDDLTSGRVATITELAGRSNFNVAHVSRRITLAFLAPDILERILNGTQPIGLTPERLGSVCPLPTSWDDQRALLLA
jgi:hypothetical protein